MRGHDAGLHMPRQARPICLPRAKASRPPQRPCAACVPAAHAACPQCTQLGHPSRAPSQCTASATPHLQSRRVCFIASARFARQCSWYALVPQDRLTRAHVTPASSRRLRVATSWQAGPMVTTTLHPAPPRTSVSLVGLSTASMPTSRNTCALALYCLQSQQAIMGGGRRAAQGERRQVQQDSEALDLQALACRLFSLDCESGHDAVVRQGVATGGSRKASRTCQQLTAAAFWLLYEIARRDRGPQLSSLATAPLGWTLALAAKTFRSCRATVLRCQITNNYMVWAIKGVHADQLRHDDQAACARSSAQHANILALPPRQCALLSSHGKYKECVDCIGVERARNHAWAAPRPLARLRELSAARCCCRCYSCARAASTISAFSNMPVVLTPLDCRKACRLWPRIGVGH